MFIYKFSKIGECDLPREVEHMTEILGTDIYLEETLGEAVKSLLIQIKNLKSPMPSYSLRKKVLVNKIKDIYSDEFPELFI